MKIKNLFLISLILSSEVGLAAGKKQGQPPQQKVAPSVNQLSQALQLARAGQNDRAVTMLFALSKKPEFAAEKMQIKYILGSLLMDMKYYQVAAFQFVDIIRSGAGTYTKQAIEKLSIAADQLGDDTLLNYAVSKVQVDQFPSKYKDMILFRLGEIKMRNAQGALQAAELFGQVNKQSRYYVQALFNQGLAYLEAGKVQEALNTFKEMYALRASAPVTDDLRVAAKLAIARTYYQAKNWDAAIEAYREIPRDHPYWHDALFESTWALVRAAKFRSALSNFQSLHSAYYEDFYLPESLILRSILYLYICKYDEMDKVIDLFEKNYGPINMQMVKFLKSNTGSLAYYKEVESYYTKKPTTLSKSVLKYITNNGDVKREAAYLKTIYDERARLLKSAQRKTSFGAYANKILANRIRNTRLAIGDLAKVQLQTMQVDLNDLTEQASFARYEMINGRKEQLKKKIAGKDIPNQIDEKVDRSFYIQNGYEYWPFDGENWLDELGNYHYLGKQSCE